ncbi:MAG: hypothetical protein ACYTGZ_12495 [Planctomycetota bacterium]|jgi:hypothetical protein
MRLFRSFLWKEWRDHRAVVLGILAAVPPLLLIARFALPESIATDPVFVHVSTWGTLAIAVLAFGSDLVPGETRRGRLAFLARLPADLGVAFAAKVVFLLLAILFAPAFGFLVSAMLAGWPAGGMEFLGYPLLAVLYVAPWIFAVSCWLPRGALTLPGTALALALFALPFYLVHVWHPRFFPTTGDFVFWGAALGLGAFVVAWISFTRGYRFGRGFVGAGWRGLVATLVLVLPAYAYTGYRVSEWKSVDPSSDEFVVRNFVRGESGRYAFASTHMLLRDGQRVSHHALLIDLRDGSWRRMGSAGSLFTPIETLGYWEDSPVLRLDDPSSANLNGKSRWCDYLDADTAKVIKSGWSHLELPAVEQRFARDRPGYLGKRRRGWWLGLGWSVMDGVKRGVADPFRKKIFPWPGRTWNIAVRPGRWLVRVAGTKQKLRWELYDPETGAREDTALPIGNFRLLPDGRVLTHDGDRWVVSDPGTGERMSLDIGDASDLQQVRTTWLFKLWGPDRIMRIARLDPATLAFAYAKGARGRFEPMRVDRESVLGIEDRKRIVRVYPGSDRRDVVFPR